MSRQLHIARETETAAGPTAAAVGDRASLAMGPRVRVAFNARLLMASDLRGWSRYTINLLMHLPSQGVTPLLCAPLPIAAQHLARLPAGTFETIIGGSPRGLWWEQVDFPRMALAHGAQLLHSPHNFGLPGWSALPSVLTLHDAIDRAYSAPRLPWSQRYNLRSLWTRFWHAVARRSARRVITVSHHAQHDLERYFGIGADRSRVTLEAADPHFQRPSQQARDAVLSRHGLPADQYLFYVGGWETRKNIPFLLRAVAATETNPWPLVLAGGRPEQRADLWEQARSLGLADRVRFLGWVEEADLPSLYAGAGIFINPSEYEGFGLQLCEAMACGCGILAANATSLPEVLGDGGDTFPLDDPRPLAQQLDRLVTDPGYRLDLKDRAVRRGTAFSWERCAAETAAVYRELIHD